MKTLSIGIDIGGTRTKIGLVDLTAERVLETVMYPTETQLASRFEQTLGEAIGVLRTTAQRQSARVVGVGIGVSGFVFEDGTVDSTYGFMPFMEAYPLARIVETQVGLPCRVDNDARLVALGEAVFGAGKAYRRVLVLTLGTGLGVGFVVDRTLHGRLPYGHMGGHLTITTSNVACYCGKTGCLESLVSATGLTQAAERAGWRQRYPDLPLSAEAIFQESEAGNPDAVQLVGQVVGYLKTGLETYINLFAPDLIVLGGGLAKGLKPYLPRLRSEGLLGPYKSYRVVLETSALEEQAGILGSAYLFNDENN